MAQTTPMMRQYLEIKARYPDAILFFRLGDFYEMFLDDAVTASRILDITLTSRNKGAAEEIPLCGIPYHSCQPYIAKLVEQGYKVAICEQVEDPKAAKGIVSREVVRVVTPGLVVDTDTLDPKENNFLLALCPGEGQGWGLAVLDITTGEFRVTETRGPDALRSEIASIDPREVLLPEEIEDQHWAGELKTLLAERAVNRLPEWIFETDRGSRLIREFFNCQSMEAFGCARWPAAIGAAGAVLYYVQETQKGAVPHIRSLRAYSPDDFMALDDASRRNLELTATMHGGRKKGSLLGVLDRTVTAMGGRKIRQWINQPLVDLEGIRSRHGAVAELVEKSLVRSGLREALEGVYDLERLKEPGALRPARGPRGGLRPGAAQCQGRHGTCSCPGPGGAQENPALPAGGSRVPGGSGQPAAEADSLADRSAGRCPGPDRAGHCRRTAPGAARRGADP
jgi:DNA mismatch repair protein MutS